MLAALDLGPIPVLDLTGRRPLSPALVATVAEFCDGLEDRGPTAAARVVAVLVGGDGGAGGGSGLPPWPGEVSVNLVSKWERALRRLERLAPATIAVAVGRCAGAAMEILPACDYRIATPDAELALTVGEGGIWPAMALHRLAGQLGVARARALLFEPLLSASRAAELGVVDEVAADPAKALAERAAVFEGDAGIEFPLRRRLLLDASVTGFEESLGAHLAACDRALRQARKDAD